MTMPDTGSDSGIQAQILLELGKLTADVAVVKDRLGVVADHETRLRDVERWKQQQQGESAGTKDVWSRLIAGCALLAAVGSAIAQYLHP